MKKKEENELQKRIRLYNKYRVGRAWLDINERVGFLDIEASNLAATFGIIYTYCLLDQQTNKLYKSSVTFKELYNGVYDKALIKRLIKDLSHFDRVVVHYGGDRRFDIPFIRTRLVYWGIKNFPLYKAKSISDTWVILRNKFKLHSNRLGTACDFFSIEAKNHPMKPEIWAEMVTGNRKRMEHCLNYIMRHNIEDVNSLKQLYNKIQQYSNRANTSI